MAGLAKDYNQYSKGRNITFVGICTSSVASVKIMASQVERFKLQPFANMLDAAGATATAYNLPRNCNFQLVVIDGGGKIAYSADSEVSYMAEPNIHAMQIEKSLKEYSEGILGAGIPVPPDMAQAAHLFDLQQFGLVEQELTRALQDPTSAENTRFADSLRARETYQSRARLRQIQVMADEQPVQAYREALSFVEAFPKSEEVDAVSAVAATLIANQKVKQEIDAEVEYQRVVAPEMKKAATTTELKNLEPLIEHYIKMFGNTGYGTFAKNAIADKSLIVSTETATGDTPPPKERRKLGGL